MEMKKMMMMKMVEGWKEKKQHKTENSFNEEENNFIFLLSMKKSCYLKEVKVS
jgi:hypothetical protein